MSGLKGMEMDNSIIKKFVGVTIPVNSCNFRCQYCYIGQHPHPYEGGVTPFIISVDSFVNFWNPEQEGGFCYFNLCGSGETFLHPQLPELVNKLTSQGHYVDIITNGSLTSKLRELCEVIPFEQRSHVLLKFSFHYLELKKKRMLEEFAGNVNMMRSKGFLVSIEITPHDELIPYIDEIREFSEKKFGALPHITVARNENTDDIEILSRYSRDEYRRIWSVFDSQLFDFKLNIFNKKRCEFCYAGLWTVQIDLGTGDYYQCYGGDKLGNIKTDKIINYKPIGYCRMPHCFNGHAYMTFGVIPSVDTPLYLSMRDRKTTENTNWITGSARDFFSSKLYSNNIQLKGYEKVFYYSCSKMKDLLLRCRRNLRNVKKG